MTPPPDSLILLSGGLDSAANLAFAAAEKKAALTVFFNYGQRAAVQEERAARMLSEFYEVPLTVITLPWLGQLGTSALTDPSLSIPELLTHQLDRSALTTASMRAVWVPNRNGTLLNAAASVAEAKGLNRILMGLNKEEAATFPDNSEEFMSAINAAFKFSTQNGATLDSYTVRMDKKAIVAALRTLKQPFPFDFVWSCYDNQSTACLKCQSCRRLQRALL